MLFTCLATFITLYLILEKMYTEANVHVYCIQMDCDILFVYFRLNHMLSPLLSNHCTMLDNIKWQIEQKSHF